ncbi:hypothetical protein QNA19_24625, partial [Rhodococcus fascians]|nr:hypothetical protein [Rhodococcus fascians]
LAEIIAGVRPAGTARLRLDGAPYRPASPAAAKDAGVVLVPEDRQRQGIQPGWSIGRTVGLPVLRQISRWGVVS